MSDDRCEFCMSLGIRFYRTTTKYSPKSVWTGAICSVCNEDSHHGIMVDGDYWTEISRDEFEMIGIIKS